MNVELREQSEVKVGEKSFIAPPITASELLIDSNPLGDIPLDSEPITIKVAEIDDTCYYRAFFDHTFAGDSFLEFLNDLGPGRGTTLNGVLADFSLPITSQDVGSREEQERLLAIHRRIPNWEKLEPYISDLSEALLTPSPEEFADEIRQHSGNRRQVIELMGTTFLGNLSSRKYFEVSDFGNVLLDNISKKLGIENKSNKRRIKIVKEMLENLTNEERGELYGNEFELLDPSRQEVIINHFLTKNFGERVSDPEFFLFRKKRGFDDRKPQLSFSIMDSGDIEFRQGKASIRSHVILDENGDSQLSFYDETATYSKQLKGSLSWSKKNHQRDIKIGEPEVDRGSNETYLDVLGLSILPYIEPELRGKWRDRLGAPGTKGKQLISAPQVLLYAMLFMQDIVRNSKLIPAMEEWVEQNRSAS